jgi:hypothetical protein
MISFTYECWKCSEDHQGSAESMEEIRYIEEDLNVKVKVIV